MNKLVIPTILLATVMVAGIFAFAPVNQVSTVHDTIQSSMEIRDIYAFIGDADDDNSDAITFDFLLVSRDGDAITGLDENNMDADFTAGTDPDDFDILVTFDDSGAYRITIDPTTDWDLGRTSIVLTVTDGGNSASTLLVVDIPAA